MRVPDATGVTAPIPWLMVADVALVVVQLSVLDCPAVMDCGDALNVTVGGGVTVTVAVAVAEPVDPTAVIV